MKDGWKEFAAYSDYASAEITAGLLRSESIEVEIAADEPIPGLARGFRLMVPSGMLHQAQMITANAAFTDDELDALARGATNPEDESPE
jgi:hypothetical protein